MTPGTFVKLKSGSETMMVAAVAGEIVECFRYIDGKCIRGTFPWEDLEQMSLMQVFGSSLSYVLYDMARGQGGSYLETSHNDRGNGRNGVSGTLTMG